jgi:fatty acid desaturase
MLAITCGVFHHLLAVHVLHDVSHGSYGHNSLLWSIMEYWSDVVVGHSSKVWRVRHCLGHHLFTNLSGVDPDIASYKASPHKPVMLVNFFLKNSIQVK